MKRKKKLGNAFALGKNPGPHHLETTLSSVLSLAQSFLAMIPFPAVPSGSIPCVVSQGAMNIPYVSTLSASSSWCILGLKHSPQCLTRKEQVPG